MSSAISHTYELLTSSRLTRMKSDPRILSAVISSSLVPLPVGSVISKILIA